MFITTYSRSNANVKEILKKKTLGRSSVSGELIQKDIMITYRKPLSVKDMLRVK